MGGSPSAQAQERRSLMPNNVRLVLASSVAAALAAAACHSRSTTPPASTPPSPEPATPPAAPVADEPAPVADQPAPVADEPAPDADQPAPAPKPTGGLTRADFKGDRCTPEALVLRFGTMKPARPVDYLELRQTSRFAGSTDVQARQSFGTSCKRAADPKACATALAAASAEDSLFPDNSMSAAVTYLVAQSGAEITTISTPTELRKFLGTIDTPAEAMLLALAGGYEPLCTDSKARKIPGGYELLAMKSDDRCLNQYYGHKITVNDTSVTSTAVLDMTSPDEGCAVAGRRPEGYKRKKPPRATADELLAYLDEMQALEAASIPAFLRLAQELADHGAPAGLIARAQQAADDEVRHAAGFARLRETLGADPLVTPTISTTLATRSLAELALENAVEGCVRETFGALLAHYQAATATDDDLRQLLVTIAEDETRHAELAWDLRAWLDLHLDTTERARVLAAEAAERTRLAAALAIEPHPDVASRCGLPPAHVAAVLHDHCVAGLWAA